jgi:hypothetical protein
MRTALGPADLRVLGIVPATPDRDLDRRRALLAAEPDWQRRPWRALGEHEGDQVVVCEVAAVPRSGLPHGVARTDRPGAAARWQPRIPARRAGIG